MTTLERLEAWREAGVISDAQHASLSAIVRRDRFSVFVELNAILYIGVIALVTGMGWTAREYSAAVGDAVILLMLAVVMVVAFSYCFIKAPPYANHETESPSFGFDYVLYFACLVLSATLAFVETRFALFKGWEGHLLIASVVFLATAYRFDNRFVLSLALSTLAGYLGLTIGFDTLDSDRLRIAGFLYGAFLLGAGVVSKQLAIKPHFLDVYLQLGANAVLLAAASGVLGSRAEWEYLLVLLVLSAAAIGLGIHFKRFAFVAYGAVFGYGGLSIRLIDGMNDAMLVLLYFVVSASLVAFALVRVARRFGRDA